MKDKDLYISELENQVSELEKSNRDLREKLQILLTLQSKPKKPVEKKNSSISPSQDPEDSQEYLRMQMGCLNSYKKTFPNTSL